MAARTFRKKKTNNKVLSFSALFFMFTLTWITEKELERVTENKEDEFRREKNIAAVRKRETLAASKVKMSGGEK